MSALVLRFSIVTPFAALLISSRALAQTSSATGAAEADAAGPPTTSTEHEKAKWYDAVKVEGFVDSYFSANFNAPEPNVNGFRSYDVNNGAALHWAGLNASVAPEPVGGTVSLRFGPSALIHNGPNDTAVGLTYVKQAFASWKPLEKWTFDFGKYDQPFGSEVADSQYNPNYTRSILYWYAQPLFFTGARVDFAPNDTLDFKLFAANGWNRSVDNNNGKSFGAQVYVHLPLPSTFIALGYMGGPEQPDSVTCAAGTSPDESGACVPTAGAPGGTSSVSGANSRFRHLADVVFDSTPVENLRFLFNADYGAEKLPAVGATAGKTVKWYGANLVVAYTFGDLVTAAVRGGYFVDNDGFMTLLPAKAKIMDGTFTLSFTPTKNLRFMLDLRMDKIGVDGATEGVFAKGLSDHSKTQVTSTLGVIATTN